MLKSVRMRDQHVTRAQHLRTCFSACVGAHTSLPLAVHSGHCPLKCVQSTSVSPVLTGRHQKVSWSPGSGMKDSISLSKLARKPQKLISQAVVFEIWGGRGTKGRFHSSADQGPATAGPSLDDFLNS